MPTTSGWPADEFDAITLNYTSGTTGNPKGALYHHRGCYLNTLGQIIHHQLNSNSVYLWTLPMFHVQRLVLCLGHGGDRRHPCLPPQSPAGAKSSNSIERKWRDAYVRRADGARHADRGRREDRAEARRGPSPS